MLTNDEARLLAYAYAIRHDEQGKELWFAVFDDLFVEACRCWGRGWLSRRRSGDGEDFEYEYRMSDKGWTAKAVSDAIERERSNVN